MSASNTGTSTAAGVASQHLTEHGIRTCFNFCVLSSSDVDNDGVGSAVVDVAKVRD